MNIQYIINKFIQHVKLYGLGGDPNEQEIYKWKLVTEQIGHPDVNATDFVKEINSLSLKNLCYSTQTTAIRNFAKYEPEEYRKAFIGLFDESIDLQKRIDKFISDCKELWDGKIKQNFTQKTSAMCDERLISFFLTLKDPTKYTFYKDEVYGCLCNLLGEKKKSAGKKLVHFYNLLNNHVIPVVENNTELIDYINKEIDIEGYVHSTPLIAQTVLWNYARYIRNNDKTQTKLLLGGNDTWLVGHAFGSTNSQFDRFIAEGIWEGRFDENKPVDLRQITLARKIKTGDVILLKSTATKGPNHDIPFMRIKAVGIVTDKITEEEETEYLTLRCNVNYLSTTDKDFDGSIYGSYRQTVHEADDKVKDVIEYANSIINPTRMPQQKYSKYIDLLKESKNLVLTGAPGTGKTFMAQAIAEEMGCSKEEMCFVQFHPSYDYTDFVEGLRPIEKADGQMGFERRDGVFKEFCKKALLNKSDETIFEEYYNKLIISIQRRNTVLETEKKYVTVIGNELKIKSKDGRSSNDEKKTAPKETIKSLFLYIIENGVEFDEANILSKKRCNEISQLIGGPKDVGAYAVLVLKWLIKETKNVISSNKQKPFILIIDEINRGEASKIFGELFYAIDPGYRGKKDVRVKTQYQNLVPNTDMFAEGFYVPENVYILATMNDIDRSVESMDFAMRRRFTWYEVTPEDTQDMLDTMPCATEAKAVMARLNDAIADTEGLGPAYMVGPSYFLKLADNNGNFDKLWTMNIEPLLREYLRGFRKANDIMKKFKKAYFAETEETTSDVLDELE